MKKITATILFMAAYSYCPPLMGEGDIYTGTLGIKDGRPILVGCDLVRPIYELVDINGSQEAMLALFSEMGLDKTGTMHAQILGKTEMNDSRLRLRVESIGRPSPGGCSFDTLMEASQ